MFAIDIQDQILDKLNTLVIVINNNGNVEYVSQSAQQLLGYNSSHLLGDAWWELPRFSKKEGELVKQKIVSSINNETFDSKVFEHELKTLAGGKKWIRWNVSRLNDEQLIGIGSDVTDNKVKERKLIEANKQLEEQNKNVTDSIYYAQRIQQSILQNTDELNKLFNRSFLLYKPKDIVSGDYYWFYEDETYKYIAVVDCTGHGVPGAMMSMVANSLFKEVFLNRQISEPSEILKAIDEELAKSINKNTDGTFSDGMDVALIRVNKTTHFLDFSGAFRPLFIVSQGDLIELKGSRYPIGFYSGIEKEFETISHKLLKNDSLYLTTDGFIDQFGGERNKKLNKTNFKDLLLTINDMSIDEQESFLDYSFNNWKQNQVQTDDVLVIGIKI